MDSQTRQAIQRIADELQRTQAEVRTLRRGGRTPQLGHSSIEKGTLDVRDPDSGATRLSLGWIDGAAAIVTEGGDPPAAPTAPNVEPSLGGLRVTWDGTLDNEISLPADFDRVDVHVSTESGFTPSAATRVGSIRRAGAGGMLPVVPLPYQVHYVVLVPVTTGGVAGAPSAEASATPLQVDAPDLTAGSVQAVHVAAGAIEADKLEAVLALVTTIIGGIPDGARVELDQDGLRGYDESGVLIFAIDSSGNAVFSGTVSGSLITGSRMVIGGGSGGFGEIVQDGDVVNIRARAANAASAFLRASTAQSEVTAFADGDDPGTPGAGLVAVPGAVTLSLSSSNNDAVQPGAAIGAQAGQAWLTLRSQRSGDGPRADMSAAPGSVSADYSSGTNGERIRILAQPGFSALYVAPETSTSGTPSALDGAIFGFRPSTTDAPVMSLQSPVTESGTDGERRSILHVEGATPGRPYTQISHFARGHVFGGELVDGATSTADGMVTVGATHSVLSVRHRYVRGSYLDVEPTSTTTASFVDFTAGQWERITFRSSASGATRVVINASAINVSTGNSLINIGFRVGPLAGHRHRSAEMRAANTSDQPRLGCWVGYIDLDPDTVYTLVPQWRLSSGRWVAAGAENPKTAYMTNLSDNSIIVEPLT